MSAAIPPPLTASVVSHAQPDKRLVAHCLNRDEEQSNLPVLGVSTPRTELLCNVRGLLKKIGQSVLVGDRVHVAGIDWDAARGA